MRTRYKRDSVYVSQAAKKRMYSAILWQAVFGKEDLMHTLPVRDVKMRSVVIPTRSKA
jgi:hypothetical protein